MSARLTASQRNALEILELGYAYYSNENNPSSRLLHWQAADALIKKGLAQLADRQVHRRTGTCATGGDLLDITDAGRDFLHSSRASA